MIAALCCLLAPLGIAWAQKSAQPVRVWEGVLTLPSYEEGLPDPNPPFDFFGGLPNYPYTLRNNLTDRRAPRAWRALYLENDYLKCVVLPDLGGHLYGCKDKINGVEMFYANPSIKLAQIAYRGAWAAFGVEFNFPVSHNWMTTSPVDFATSIAPDGSASVWVGNIDRVYGMHWRVQLTLRPGRAMLEQHTTLYNRSEVRRRFYWWTNAAVQAWDDTRIIYPMAFSAAHGFRDVDTWPVNSAGVDLSVVGSHKFGPVSRFSYASREPYMAISQPSTDSGVVHYSSPLDLPAKKIWSWGSDPDGLDWRRALSDDNSAYVEIQAGLFRDQETCGFLEPQQAVQFSEYWIPVRGLGGVSRANPDGVVHMARSTEREGTVVLEVALNVTQALPNATLLLSDGARTVSAERISLTPAETWRKPYAALPAAGVYTIELRDAAGHVVLSHTEGKYDSLLASEVRLGAQPIHSLPPPADRREGDFVELGAMQERNGNLLGALATYREGLARFPANLELHKALGRLALTLMQYDAAVLHLGEVLARVSNDYEAAYYLGLAYIAQGQVRRARPLLEAAQQFGALRPAALLALGGLAARGGDHEEALQLLQRVSPDTPEGARTGATSVALMRAVGRTDDARMLLARLRSADPTSSLLRHEATRLGTTDGALWWHLAADPERIFEIATDYMRFALNEDALDLLVRSYPSGGGVVGEPGMPRPESYSLIAYYRGYVRELLGQSGAADFDAAARMPTTYVFPNRPETFPVLRRALAHNPNDATAHFLLGMLYLAGGMAKEALASWETAMRLNPRIPTLHRNMAYTILRSGENPERAVTLLSDGIAVDPGNVGLYVGLEEAMRIAGRSANDRADALLRFPDLKVMPATMVYQLARLLAEAGRFDDAERLFVGRFFPRKEGGINVREVYLDVRVRRAEALANSGSCQQALEIVARLKEPVAGLSFTNDGLEPILESARFRERINKIKRRCAQ